MFGSCLLTSRRLWHWRRCFVFSSSYRQQNKETCVCVLRKTQRARNTPLAAACEAARAASARTCPSAACRTTRSRCKNRCNASSDTLAPKSTEKKKPHYKTNEKHNNSTGKPYHRASTTLDEVVAEVRWQQRALDHRLWPDRYVRAMFGQVT